MKISVYWLAIMAMLQASVAFAQSDGIYTYQEYEKSVTAARQVSPLGDAPFGERVSMFSGATEFSVTDISLPGNNALPVALGRRFVIADRNGYWKDTTDNNDWFLGGFEDWDVEVPYLEGTFSNDGWIVDDPDSGKRCSALKAPIEFEDHFYIFDFYRGTTLHIPGRSDEKIVISDPLIPAVSGGSYPWATVSGVRLGCLSQTKNYSGEGFVALTPDGVKYYFDWETERGAAMVNRYVYGPNYMAHAYRKRVFLLATRMEDRFGNWVNFNYSGGSLTGISSSDGRSISISYAGGRVATAVANGRTWTYSYGDGAYGLIGVVLPTGEQWTYQKSGILQASREFDPPRDVDPADPCMSYATTFPPPFEYVVKHPSGMQGKFKFVKGRAWRIPTESNSCVDPSYFDRWAISEKVVTGLGLNAQMTTFSFDQSSSIDANAWNTMTNPDGTKRQYRYGKRYTYDANMTPIDEGLLLEERSLNSSGGVVQTKLIEYQNVPNQTAPFIQNINRAEQFGSISIKYTRDGLIRPVKEVAITRDGVVFTNAIGANSFDAFARPLSVTKSSSLGYSRSETTAYSDNLSKWVLGQVKSVTCTASVPASSACDGDVMSQTDYDATTALPLKTYAFGKLKQTLTYNTDGTVATVKDGNNNVTTLSSWKRGTPQSIKHPVTPESPSGATESAVVDDNGWIQSVTDETGAKTCYGYDLMGRINLITYPSETQAGVCDTSAWASTSITFADGNPAAYGMPAGHWRQTTLTGHGRKVTIFDALWRPVVEQSLDLGNTTGTMSEVVKRYDTQGRLVFQSYPMNTNGQANYTDTTLKGTTTSYDALDRPTTVKQDSELGVLTTTTEYLSGFQTRVTNPRGQKTTTSYMAWDQPTTDLPVAVDQPKGVRTTIPRDAYGKPLQVTRSGPDQ